MCFFPFMFSYSDSRKDSLKYTNRDEDMGIFSFWYPITSSIKNFFGVGFISVIALFICISVE